MSVTVKHKLYIPTWRSWCVQWFVMINVHATYYTCLCNIFSHIKMPLFNIGVMLHLISWKEKNIHCWGIRYQLWLRGGEMIPNWGLSCQTFGGWWRSSDWTGCWKELTMLKIFDRILENWSDWIFIDRRRRREIFYVIWLAWATRISEFEWVVNFFLKMLLISGCFPGVMEPRCL